MHNAVLPGCCVHRVGLNKDLIVWPSVASLLSKNNPQSKQDMFAKGHCKGEDSGGECATKLLQKPPFSNQHFDTENHYCLIECCVHEIEGH